MKILVTGAAGFIGSVTTEQLVEQGHDVIALDSLKHGFREAVHPDARFVKADVLDQPRLRSLMEEERVEAVMHLAAEALIDDSLRDPGLFYRVNVSGGLSLLEAMMGAGVRRIVFSSSAAVYGEPAQVPITEDAPTIPCNSYGESKLAFEQMLRWYRTAYDLSYVCLRYFNACGATRRCGESRRRETHLIPLALAAAAAERDGLSLFGTDYDTPDGTCIRDYIHVADIAGAHIRALDALDRLGARVYNLGNGKGYSNRQVIETVKEVTGRPFTVEPADRRPGDPARLIADAQTVQRELGWEPAFPGLHDMVASAWNWRLEHPGGYCR